MSQLYTNIHKATLLSLKKNPGKYTPKKYQPKPTTKKTKTHQKPQPSNKNKTNTTL